MEDSSIKYVIFSRVHRACIHQLRPAIRKYVGKKLGLSLSREVWNSVCDMQLKQADKKRNCTIRNSSDQPRKGLRNKFDLETPRELRNAGYSTVCTTVQHPLGSSHSVEAPGQNALPSFFFSFYQNLSTRNQKRLFYLMQRLKRAQRNKGRLFEK